MRLIDADALKKEFPKDSDWEYPVNTNSYVCETIDAQPTIEEHKTGLWIPCSERLPESDERVLVYTVGKEFHVWDAMPHRAESYAWEDEEGLYHSLYEVDLWMPLPEL